jgi:LuxR family maltose regulon positive regulatory protein
VDKNALPRDPALLTTKLHVPQARSRLVARPCLISRLSDGAARPLVLISAPAGFGKTTLLAEWIPQSESCVCWVSLDDGDNDPARSWSCVIGALQMLQSTLGQSARLLLEASRLRADRASPRRQATWIEPFLTALLNDLTAFPDHFCLVLDDYHVIENQTIHQGVAFLLGHLPPQMHLIITARADPPLPLARLRAGDQLLELRAADLRFTVALFLPRQVTDHPADAIHRSEALPRVLVIDTCQAASSSLRVNWS